MESKAETEFISGFPKGGLHETIELYKDSIGPFPNILCDYTYLEYLCGKNSDARDIDVLHKEIAQLFGVGVNQLSFYTTWCVYETLNDKYKAALNRGIPKITEQAALAKKYALGVEKVCDHTEDRINSWRCLKNLLKSEFLNPYCFASLDRKSIRKVMKKFGLPILTVDEGKLTVLPIGKKQKKKLKRIKAKRIHAWEEKQKREKQKQLEDEEKRLKLEAFEQKVAKNIAESGEKYVSKRVRVKKKRNRKKKSQSLTDLYKIVNDGLPVEEFSERNGASNKRRGEELEGSNTVKKQKSKRNRAAGQKRGEHGSRV